MKKKKEIIIEVDEDGKINFETVGFVGEECITNPIVNHIKDALGKGLGPEFKPIFKQKNQNRVKHVNLCG